MTESATKHTTRETVFDVDVEKLTRVYAQAGLDAAGSAEDQDALIGELGSLVSEVLDKFPEFEQILGSSLVSQEEKLDMLDRVFSSRLSTTGLNFLKVMAAHGRLSLLRHVARSAGEIWQSRNNRSMVQIELAQEATPPLLQEIISSLQKSLGAEPIVKTSVNSDLIAGFVVRVGDRVYDASARSSFERARTQMMARATEVIQDRPERFIEN